MHASVERLLSQARRHTGRADLTISEVGARMGVSAGVLTNWKTRGISKEGAINAENLFGGTAIWVLTGRYVDRSPTVVFKSSDGGAPAPPDYTAREVSESDWALLQDIRVLPETEREKLVSSIRADASKWKAITDEMLKRQLVRRDK